MLARVIRSQPIFIVLMGLCACAMYAPVFVAATLENWKVARTFFYSGSFCLMLTIMIGIPFLGRDRRRNAVSHLRGVFFAFLILPAMMALPLFVLVDHLSFFHAYFEMLSSFTTTGASLLDEPTTLPIEIHLWRGGVAWLGGLLMLVVAMAIFAPLNIGGFEVYSTDVSTDKGLEFFIRTDTETRLWRYTRVITPIYVLLTAVLSVALILAGEGSSTAVIHAMSVLSTSGISPVGGLENAGDGYVGEALIFLFLFTAVSRFTFLQDKEGRGWANFKRGKEINIALTCLIVIPFLLFIRHWTAAFEVSAEQDSVAAFTSLWGGMFTVLSFLTTTGFESRAWDASQFWSGLNTPGLIFMALAIMGGGVATTAGGVKLLRVYALFQHGTRELERLRFPNSVGGSGKKARSMRRDGAYISWIFLMLFVLILAVIMLALSATGLGFIDGLIISVAGLSTTGPLLNIATESGLTYSDISDPAKGVMCAAMILGRLESLAVIALINANFWRN